MKVKSAFFVAMSHRKDLSEAYTCIRAMVDHMRTTGDAWLEEIAEDLYGDAIRGAEAAAHKEEARPACCAACSTCRCW